MWLVYLALLMSGVTILVRFLDYLRDVRERDRREKKQITVIASFDPVHLFCIASRSNCLPMVRYVNEVFGPFERNTYNRAIMEACLFGNSEHVVRYLIHHGADNLELPMNIAKDRKHNAMIKCLLNSGLPKFE